MADSVAKLIQVSEVLNGARVLCDRNDRLRTEEVQAIEVAYTDKRLQENEAVTRWALDGIAEACRTRFVPYRMQYRAEMKGTLWLIRVVARPPLRMAEDGDAEDFQRNYVLPDHWKNAASVATEILAIRSMVEAKNISLQSVASISHPNPGCLGLNLVAIIVAMDSSFAVPVNLKLPRMQPPDLHAALLAFSRKILRQDIPRPQPDQLPERPHGPTTSAPLADDIDPKNYLRLLQKKNKTTQEKLYLEKKKLVSEQGDQFMASHVAENPKERRIRTNVNKWFPDPYKYDSLVDAQSVAEAATFEAPALPRFQSLADELNPAINPPLAKKARGKAPARGYDWDDEDDGMIDDDEEEVQRRRDHAAFLQQVGGTAAFGLSTAMPITGGQARHRVDVMESDDDDDMMDIEEEEEDQQQQHDMYGPTFGLTAL